MTDGLQITSGSPGVWRALLRSLGDWRKALLGLSAAGLLGFLLLTSRPPLANGGSTTHTPREEGTSASAKKAPKKTKAEVQASRARKEKAFEVLQEVLRAQDHLNSSGPKAAEAPKTLPEAYRRLTEVDLEDVDTDPLGTHGFTLEEFESLSTLYRDDPLYNAHWEMLLIAMRLPSSNVTSPKAKKNGKKTPVNGQKKNGKNGPKKNGA
eukprot:TRINITY_DN121439_c0_g1_i1.p1 TRINITY_DN121439_c0_g1~~TRINITY_DN121439_c0_g1_i1.p1  ORF type:complete len:209 (+),score=48.67 TRINITY_DN121439_c0_g1_i1:81-707(+)